MTPQNGDLLSLRGVPNRRRSVVGHGEDAGPVGAEYGRARSGMRASPELMVVTLSIVQMRERSGRMTP